MVKEAVQRETKYTTDKLNRRELDTQSQLSSWGLLKGALSKFKDSLEGLKDPTRFQSRKAVVTNDPTVDSDTPYFTATVNNTAINGQYDVEVQQLAQSDKYISKTYATSDVRFSTGALRITVGYGQPNSRTFDVAIGADSNRLVDIRNAINRASGTDVGATIITGDDGVRLVIGSNKAGVKNSIHVDIAADNGDFAPLLMDLTGGLTQSVIPQDSKIKVDGQLVTTSSNVLTDVIEGVSLNLLKAELGKTHKLTINSDMAAATKYIELFVTAHNELREQIHDLTRVDVVEKDKHEPVNSKKKDDDKAKKKSNSGDLHNDPVLRQLDSSLRNCLTKTIIEPTGITSLQAIGITSDRAGKLTINRNRLTSVLGTNPDAVGRMLADPDEGVAANMYTTVDGFLNGTVMHGTAEPGQIKVQETRLKQQLRDIEIAKLKNQQKAALLENRYLQQFADMDQRMYSMSTSAGEMLKRLDTSFVEPGRFEK
jgi:flagellar hook-associated protein 2